MTLQNPFEDEKLQDTNLDKILEANQSEDDLVRTERQAVQENIYEGKYSKYFASIEINEPIFMHQEYFRVYHAIELMFRSKRFSDETEQIIIESIYQGLNLSKRDGELLVQLCARYNKEQFFLKFCTNLLLFKKTQEGSKAINKVASFSFADSNTKEVTEKYTAYNCIRDGVLWSLYYDNVSFFDMVIKKFRDASVLYPFKITIFIVKKLERDYLSCHTFPFIDDLIRVMTRI